LLRTEIKVSPDAKQLDLMDVSSSMYSEAFSRYSPEIFRRLFFKLLKNIEFMEIPEFKDLGRFCCIDGSIFPAFQTMDWAHYTKEANAIKIHLLYELNRMAPVQFLLTDANSSEKSALISMLEKGITYIADRGYVSFELFNKISLAGAFFIIRSKSNLILSVQKKLDVVLPEQWVGSIFDVTDQEIKFDNDENDAIYRLITFMVNDETYFIVTNRFDLDTHQVIMFYAYRWQIELFFLSIKRTFNSIHLWSHDQNGIQIHFYIYLITYILLLNFKQKNDEFSNSETISNSECKPESEPNLDSESNLDLDKSHNQKRGIKNNKKSSSRNCIPKNSRLPDGETIVSKIGSKLKRFWKLGKHWLWAVKVNLMQEYTIERARIICSVMH